MFAFQVTDHIQGSSTTPAAKHRGLLYSFFMMPFVTALSGACFLVSSFYLPRDRQVVKATVSGHSDENRTLLNHGDYDDDANNDVVDGDVMAHDVTQDSDGVTDGDFANGDVITNNVQADSALNNKQLGQANSTIQRDNTSDSDYDNTGASENLLKV